MFGLSALNEISNLLVDALTGMNGWAYVVERSGPNAGMLVGSTSTRSEDACQRGCVGERLYTITGSRLAANMSAYKSIDQSAHIYSRGGWQPDFVEKRSSTTTTTLIHECYLKSAFEDCPLAVADQYVRKTPRLESSRMSGPQRCPTRENCLFEDTDFGGNPRGFLANGEPISCGYAGIVAIGASSAEFVAPSWYNGELVVDSSLQSARACQLMCQENDDCDFFSYLHRGFVGFEAQGTIYHGLNNAFDWLLVAGQDISCDPGFIYFEGNCVNCGSGLHSRRRDCHFAVAPSSSLLKRLLSGEGSTAE